MVRPGLSPSEILARRGPGRAKATDVDRRFGAAVRERRIELGLTQQHLASLVGVTYQQQHKRELGINRFSMGSAVRTAEALGTTIEALLRAEPALNDAGDERKVLEMMRQYRRLHPDLQDVVRALVRALAGDG